MKKSENYELSNAQQLMLVQGISLIEDGLTFIEWAEQMPNENTYDATTILRDRFEYFKDFALFNYEHNHLLVDKAKKQIKNTNTNVKTKEILQKALKDFRSELTEERNKFKEQ